MERWFRAWSWHAVLSIVVVAAVAFGVSGRPEALAAGALIGLVLVSARAAMYYVWQRLLPPPTPPGDATEAERARLAQRYAARTAVPIVVLAAAGVVLASVLPDDGPSATGILYFSLPVVMVAALYAYLAVKAREK